MYDYYEDYAPEIFYDEYKFYEEEGEIAARLVHKKWGRKTNLLCFFETESGMKFEASAWKSQEYLGLKNIPIGTELILSFEKSKSGKVYMRGAKVM